MSYLAQHEKDEGAGAGDGGSSGADASSGKGKRPKAVVGGKNIGIKHLTAGGGKQPKGKTVAAAAAAAASPLADKLSGQGNEGNPWATCTAKEDAKVAGGVVESSPAAAAQAIFGRGPATDVALGAEALILQALVPST